MAKKNKSTRVSPAAPISDRERGVAISQAIHGVKHARPELGWVIELEMAALPALPDPGLEADWQASIRPRIQAIFDKIVQAVGRRDSRPFKHMAECIEDRARRGSRWSDTVSQAIVQASHDAQRKPISRAGLIDKGVRADPKTISKKAKLLGVQIQKPGRPAKSGK